MGKAELSAEEQAARMAQVGAHTSERKAEASRRNGRKGGAYPVTEATRAKLRAAWQIRKARGEAKRKLSQAGREAIANSNRRRAQKADTADEN